MIMCGGGPTIPCRTHRKEPPMSERVTVLSVGDLILDVPGVGAYFDESRDILRGGDVVIGQVEIPYTARPHWST